MSRRSSRPLPFAIAVGMAAGALALSAVALPAAAETLPPTYYPSGPQTSVDSADLAGWTLCYSGPYGDSGVALHGPGGIIDELCTGDYLMLAGGPIDDPILTVLAAAPRADVLTDTGTDFTTTHNANGSEWYFSDVWSWGFALGGDTVDKDNCDVESTNGQYRLCFHTQGSTLVGGYRAGTNEDLNGATDWIRYVYQSSGTPAAALAETGVSVTQPLIGGAVLLALGAMSVAISLTMRRRTAR